MILCREPIVAESAGIPIYAGKGIRAVSFMNSPYYAHMHLGAVDLYPSSYDDGVPSPVSGRVVGIREVKAPHIGFRGADEKEKLLLISNTAETTTKLLHLNPFVSVGDTVTVSEIIGEFVRSGFFSFWTPHHIHVEVRSPSDPIRARGAFPMVPMLPSTSSVNLHGEADLSDLECEVVTAKSGFLLLRPLSRIFALIGGFAGMAAIVGETKNAILDGGFPHYSRGGIVVETGSGLKIGDTVRIGSLLIGEISSNPLSRKCGCASFALVDFRREVDVSVSSIPMRGLSLALNLSSPESCLLRVIPREPLETNLIASLKDNVVLSIRNIVS
jgi:hypothetical protein